MDYSSIIRQSLTEAYINEALITFGKQAYPKFNNIVIMAGGAGSGKGFIVDKLIGLEGWKFDVDHLKLMTTRVPGIIAKLRKEHDIDITKYDTSKNKLALKDPVAVSHLHEIVADILNLDNRRKSTQFASALLAPPDRKPNMIFDVTMKSLDQLRKYTLPLQDIGYDRKNIHIVWVVNQIDIARKQNQERSRTVFDDILLHTHQGAQQTMWDIVKMGEDIQKYMDGDIVFCWNQAGVDNEWVAGNKRDKDLIGGNSASVGGYFKRADYVYIKRQGQKINNSLIDKQLMQKVKEYTPAFKQSWTDS